jgi:selenocysteine-specific elongation factor
MVLRAYSPAITIGGATVIDASPARRSRLDSESKARLEMLESGSLAERLSVLVGESGTRGLHLESAVPRLGAPPEAALAAAIATANLVRIRDGRFLASHEWRQVLDRVLRAVEDHHKEHKLRHGIPKGDLKSHLKQEVEGAVFDEALETLVKEGRLSTTADRVGLPLAGPTLSALESIALNSIERRLASSGFQVPEISAVLGELPDGVERGELLRHLLEAGRVVKVTSDLLYPTPMWDEIERRVRAHFASKASLSMSEFKGLLQVSRKYSVPILEHLDRTGLTRRDGDNRAPGPRLRG